MITGSVNALDRALLCVLQRMLLVAKTIIVASHNPVKIEAAQKGFAAMFPDEEFVFQGVSVPSGVSDQPMSQAETRQGAENRVRAAWQACPGAAYAIGIEGGVQDGAEGLGVSAWICVTDGQTMGRAMTGLFFLPQEVADLIHQGLELGDADDRVFGRSNSKQANGSIGLLTDDALTRTDYYVQAVIMALIPFKKPQFTWK
jgi:inosine/xanthosine triphosphatase